MSQVCNSKETDTQRQVSLRGKHLVLGPCHTYCSPQTKYDRLAVVSNAQFECKKKKIYMWHILVSFITEPEGPVQLYKWISKNQICP